MKEDQQKIQVPEPHHIHHEFGQGFFFGWTFGLGLFTASLIGALIIKMFNAFGVHLIF